MAMSLDMTPKRDGNIQSLEQKGVMSKTTRKPRKALQTRHNCALPNAVVRRPMTRRSLFPLHSETPDFKALYDADLRAHSAQGGHDNPGNHGETGHDLLSV